MKRFLFIAAVLLSAISCTDMFENVREYAPEETIYANRLDGVLKTYIGFERVEFDLLNAGRIPASKMHLGRATKTVIECDDFTEEGHRRVIDSLCSWVNITGLTQPKNYQFTIYTEDKYGNRSLPLKAEARPYTRENLSSLSLSSPSVVESDAAALLEWKDHLSTSTYSVLGYSYHYIDKDGIEHSGSADGDLPSFFVENIKADTDIPVTMICRTIPTITEEDGSYTPILDEVAWESIVNFRLSPGARPALFLKSPEPAFSVDRDDFVEVFPLTFSWIKLASADGYVLKFSDKSDFSSAQTQVVSVGNVSQWEMSREYAESLLKKFAAVRSRDFYWRVEPVSGTEGVTLQSRKFTVTSSPHIVARYGFDGSDWTTAEVGKPLTAYNGGILSVDGPSAADKAVSIGQGSYIGIPHNLSGASYTLMLRVRWSDISKARSLVQLNKANNDRAELVVESNCLVSINGLGSSPTGVRLGPDTWHRIFLVSDAGDLAVWVDGLKVVSGNSTAERYTLQGDEILIGADNNGSDNPIDVSEAVLWDFPLMEKEMLDFMGLKKVKLAAVSASENPSGLLSHIVDGSLTTAPWSTSNLPGWVVVDMGSACTIGKILCVRHVWNGGGQKSAAFSVGDSLPAMDQWTPIWSYTRGGPRFDQWGTFYSMEFPDNSFTGRYVRVSFADGYNNMSEITEIVVFEKL